MNTYRKLLLIFMAMLSFSGISVAQTIDIGPDQYAFQFTNDPDFGLYFNATDGRYEFRNGSATPVLGFSATSGLFTTDLSFSSGSDLLIGNNRYAFRASSNPNYGLFFSSTSTEYQFLNNAASPVFAVNANNGNARLNGGLQLGNSSSAQAGNIRWTGSDFQGYTGSNWTSLTNGSGGGSIWSQSGNLIFTTNKVAIGTNQIDADYDFQISGDVLMQSDNGSLFFGYPDNGNGWKVKTVANGADMWLDSKIAGSSEFTTRFKFQRDGQFIIGDVPPKAWLQVAHNSGTGFPHIRMEETDVSDYARLEFANQNTDGKWQIAGLGEDAAVDSKLNFFYANGSEGGDLLTILGNGKVGIGNANPAEELVVGRNLETVWNVPAATVGSLGGGGLEVGTPDVKFAAYVFSTLGRTRLASTDANGFGQGTIEMLTRQLSIGTNPGVNTLNTYPLRVVQNTGTTGGAHGINLVNGSTSAANWELYVSTALLGVGGNLNLYYGTSLRGSFNSASGNYSPLSDENAKTDIEPLESVLDKIKDLPTYRYRYKEESDTGYFNGFLAQELNEYFPETVTKIDGRNEDEESKLLVDYNQIAVLAVRAIQEQNTIIEEIADVNSYLKDENSELKQANEKLTSDVEELKKFMQRIEQDLQTCCFDSQGGQSNGDITSSGDAELGQNIPNPFSENTVIRYYLPEGTTNAIIRITDMEGSPVQDLQLGAQSGASQIEFQTQGLAAGTYLYSLFVDGKFIDTKKMMIAR
jgi:hypothetical protein